MKSGVRLFSILLGAGFLHVACLPAEPAVNGTGGRAPGSGGTSATGGSSSGGSGTTSSGGTTGSGGAPGTGGVGTSSGGATGSGGRGTGGAVGSGGAISSGGATGSGGSGMAGRTGTGGLAGTGGTPGTGGGSAGSSGAATFAAVATILGTNCATSPCHQGGGHVDLRNNAGLRARLVNVAPSGAMSMVACRTRTLVVPGNPGTSVMSQVVKGVVAGCTSARMPDECSTTSNNPRRCLTDAQIATIDSWITGGALP
ncbi:MAG: hypothetical protein H7X95_07950 [Deltaproteobacteria bacterium]|nr:hypothetical protein [Deltaproteobacteria bacterium]